MSDAISRTELNLVISELSEGKTDVVVSTISNDKSVVVPPEFFKVVQNGILFFGKDAKVDSFSEKSSVKVFFYFNGRGMYFVSQFRHTKQGYAIVIPAEVYLQTDEGQGVKSGVHFEIYFSAENSDTVNIPCFPPDNFRLFDKSVAKDLSVKNPVINPKKLRSVEKFFSENNAAPRAVKSRIDPLSILYISDTQLVLGANSKNMILQNGIEYGIKMSIPLDVSARVIFATIKAVQIFGDTDDIFDVKKTCCECRFTQLKEEDKRFLYEKLFGIIFN